MKSQKKIWVSILTSSIFSVFALSGIVADSPELLNNTLGLAFFFSQYFLIGFACSFAFLSLEVKKSSFSLSGRITCSFGKKDRKISFCIVWILLMIAYVPAFLATFPGIFGYDGPVEIFEALGNGGLTAHHPLSHIYMLVGCFEVGHRFFDNYNMGLVIYNMLQILIVTCIFAYTLLWIFKRTRSFLLCVIALVYYIVNPYIQLLNYSTTKDTLSGAFFLLLLLKVIDIMEAQEHADTSTPRMKELILFLVGAMGMCLFRKPGYYILAFAMIGIGAFAYISYKKVIYMLGLSVIASWFFMGPFIDMLGIPQGDPREMLSVPMQQIARVWNEYNYGNAILYDEEVNKIEELIPVEYLREYKSNTADNVKTGFNTAIFQENIKDYTKLYFGVGIRNPKVYITAFCALSSGYWYWGRTGDFSKLLFQNTFTDPFYNVCAIERDSLWQGYEAYLEYFVENIGDFPVLHLIFSHVLSIWMMFYLVICSIVAKNRAMIGCNLLLLGQWGILILSPVMLERYGYPFLVCTPVILILILEQKNLITADNCI